MTQEYIDADILEQAAEWLVLLHSGQMSQAQQQAFSLWQQQHPSHQQAIARVSHFHRHLQQLPQQIQPKQLLDAKQHFARHLSKKLLWLISPFALSYLSYQALPWQLWCADYSSKVGEVKSLQLADGSQLTLASNSYVNIKFDQRQRKLELLSGEIYIQTAKHRAKQPPLMVYSRNGRVQALGTRFSVRQDRPSQPTTVQVYQHAVAISPKLRTTPSLRLEQGFAVQFDQQQILNRKALDQTVPYWTQHLLVVDNQPLTQVLAEINRYSKAHMLLQDQVKNIRVSGVFSLQNTAQSLETLAETYQLQLTYYSPYLLHISKK
jgi:transmembrane sensor